MYVLLVFSSRRRHTRCALVTGVQTCALPIYAAHCHRVVGDDQVAGAGIADHLIEQIAEALDIGVIKWRINFVENADGGGVGEEQPEYERDGSKGLTEASKQGEGRQLFARQPRHDIKDRTCDVEGRSVSVRVDHGESRTL